MLMEASYYDKIPLCKISYFVRSRDYWRNIVNGDSQYIIKLSRCKGRPVLPDLLNVSMDCNACGIVWARLV
jgi:hypothetical protein